jgi:hypothetical protein
MSGFNDTQNLPNFNINQTFAKIAPNQKFNNIKVNNLEVNNLTVLVSATGINNNTFSSNVLNSIILTSNEINQTGTNFIQNSSDNKIWNTIASFNYTTLGSNSKVIVEYVNSNYLLNAPDNTSLEFKICITNNSFSFLNPYLDINWFYTIGNLTQERSLQLLNLLDNNKVLLNGGLIDISTSSDIVQLYDPTTQLWSTLTPLTEPKTYHTSTKLTNGNVLIAGGCNINTNISSNICNLYISSTNSITTTSNLNTSRKNHTATLLSNGNVLVAGGINQSVLSTELLSSCEIYNKNTNTWSTVASMSNVRFDHKAILLPNNKVLVTGGFDGNTYTNTTEIYDPDTNTWSLGPSFGVPEDGRINHTLTLLNNGKVLLAGGQNYDYGITFSNCFLYNYTSNTFSQTTDMNLPRTGQSAVKFLNGEVIMIAGDNEAITCEIYNPISEKWEFTNSLKEFCINQASTILHDGNVLVTGGRNNKSQLGTVTNVNTIAYGKQFKNVSGSVCSPLLGFVENNTANQKLNFQIIAKQIPPFAYSNLRIYNDNLSTHVKITELLN